MRDAERRRVKASSALDAGRRAELGQVFTPGQVAQFLVSLFDPWDGDASLLIQAPGSAR